MFSKFNSVFAFAAAVTISVAGLGSALAATLDVSSVSGNWTGLTPQLGQPLANVQGIGTNSVSWGVPYRYSKTKKQSGYSFVGAAAGKIESDKDFNLGTFTHNNFVLNPGTSITGFDRSSIRVRW